MRLALLAVAVLATAASLSAQNVPESDTTYVPHYQLPNGRQIVVVYVGMTRCGHSRDPEVINAVRRMKPLLARQADSLAVPLSVMGVALDWKVQDGIDYLRSLGEFDEIATGSNWGNLAAISYIWHQPSGRSVVPQVLIYQRTVTPQQSTIAFGPEQELARFVGTDEIINWVARGAPMPQGH